MNIDRMQSEAARLYASRAQQSRANGPAGRAGESEGPDAASAPRSDEFEMSQGASLIRKMTGVAAAAPDVREALVNELKSQVQAGTYKPNDEAVVRNLLNVAAD